MLGWLWDALWALLEALGIVSKVPPVEEEGTRVTVKAVSGQSISLLLKPDWTILDVKQHLSQQLQAWATLFFLKVNLASPTISFNLQLKMNTMGAGGVR